MTARASVEQGLAVLGRELGMALTLGADGACRLLLDDGLECGLELPEDSELLHLYCPLRRVPDADRLAFLERVLALNLYGTATGGAALALDPASGWIVLCWSQPADAMAAEDLAALIAGFVERALALKARLAPAAEIRPEADGMDATDLALAEARGGWMRG